MMIFGIFEGTTPAGWSNWGIDDAPFAGGFAAMIGVAMIVGFSFQGTELIGIAAGESENPEKNIPRAVRQVFWRILLFYVFAILIISLIIPYTDPSLLRNDVKDISVSPFTLVFEHAGLLSAAAIMNAVILTAVLSAGNSGMYASTRMLYTLACDGKAPRIFSKLSRGGVPRNALYATTVIAALCFLTSMFGNQTVYLWLLNTSGMTGFIAWLGLRSATTVSVVVTCCRVTILITCRTVPGSSRWGRSSPSYCALSSPLARTMKPSSRTPLIGAAWRRPTSAFRCSWLSGLVTSW